MSRNAHYRGVTFLVRAKQVSGDYEKYDDDVITMLTIATTTKLMMEMIVVVEDDDDDAEGNTKGINDLSIATCNMTLRLCFCITDIIALLTTSILIINDHGKKQTSRNNDNFKEHNCILSLIL